MTVRLAPGPDAAEPNPAPVATTGPPTRATSRVAAARPGIATAPTATGRAEPARTPTLDELRTAFDGTEPLTIGVEEEVMLVHVRSGEVVPLASEVAELAGGRGITAELPSCQVELVTSPHHHVDDALAELAAARRRLLSLMPDDVSPIAAAVHPFATTCSPGPADHHRRIAEDYGGIARQQLVGSLQVHIALGDAGALVPVHDALRSHLPDLAALAASAPFHGGRHTGLASVRPLISGMLPRQGVPPVMGSLEAHVDALRWGGEAGALPNPGCWWWELRPHHLHGTLEIRVPDVQADIAGAAAIIRTVRALVAWLLHRHRDGKTLPVHPTWRIAENRWRALRDGVHGELLDLDTGVGRPTATRIGRLLDEIEAHVDGGDLDCARRLLTRNGADALEQAGLEGAMDHLIDSFAPPDEPEETPT